MSEIEKKNKDVLQYQRAFVLVALHTMLSYYTLLHRSTVVFVCLNQLNQYVI